MALQIARVVLVGTGRIGNVHFNNILSTPTIEVVGICEVIEAVRTEFNEKYGIKVYESIEAALGDAELSFDGILVCTPTPYHTAVVNAALNAGKHVFCEKPISQTLEEADNMYELAKKNGVHLLCAFQRRYDNSFYKLKDSIVGGKIGNLQKIRTISRDNPVPGVGYLKTSGGIFHDCLSHDIDLMRWIAGEEPSEVFCYATNFIDEIKEIDDFDTVECLLKWDNGIIGNIDVSRKAVYGYDQRITCLGDGGMITAENQKPTTVVIQDVNGTHSDPNCYSFPSRYPQAYADEMVHFADLILGNADKPKLTHQDVHNNAIIADALEESARSGAPVKLTGKLI